MKNFKRNLTEIPLMDEFCNALPEGADCYLVGGAVRDMLLNRPVHDLDFALTEDPTPLAQSWAQSLGAHWFWLDKERRQSRVVLNRAGQDLTFDFAPFRADSLEGDLLGRDFTINALAVDVRRRELIDPLKGLNDLDARTLKVCAATSFLDDPLRILRAARFIAVLGLQVDSATCRLAEQAVAHLAETAGERIKTELYCLFEAKELGAGLEFLARCGALHQLFGQPPQIWAFQEIEEFSGKLEHWVEALNLGELLHLPVEAGFSRKGLLRLGSFLRACKLKNPFREISQRLALSRAAAARLQSLLTFDPGTLRFPKNQLITPRQRALWAGTLGADPIDILLFSVASKVFDHARNAEIVEVIQSWQAIQVHGRVPSFIDGDWIRQELAINDGLQIGQALKQLSEAELRGEVATLEDAQKFLKSRFEKEH